MKSQSPSVTDSLLQSSGLLFLTKVFQRSLGLVSTLILARILTPEDFGLVAMVTIALYLFDILSVSGINQYITQKDTVTDDDLNCAWSVNLLLKVVVWVLFVLSIPLIVTFYENEQLYKPLFVISFVLLISGFRNPQMIMKERNLDYIALFWLFSAQKIVSFICVLLIAFLTRSYWALIIGDLVAALTLCVLSYVKFTYRPRFNLKQWKEQWQFSQWMLLKGFLGYGRAQIDTIFVSKFFPAADLGKYHMMRGLTVMPGTEIVAPMLQPLLAAFSRIKDDKENLGYQIRVSFLVLLGVLFPIWAYLFFESRLIILFLLGDQWLSGEMVFKNLTFLLLGFSVGYISGNVCIALGKVKIVFFYDLISFSIIAISLVLIGKIALEDFALLRSVLEMVLVLLYWLFTSRYVQVKNLRLLYLFLPISCSAFLAVFLARELLPAGFSYVYVEVIIFSVIFFTMYLVFMFVFYAIWFRRYPEYQKIKAVFYPKIKGVFNKVHRFKS